MATDSEILSLIDQGIVTLLSAIAAGDWITEYRMGATVVKAESPQALLSRLQTMKSEYEARTDADDRGAAFCSFGGLN